MEISTLNFSKLQERLRKLVACNGSFMWRLWKQKGQNSCYVRAREEDNDKIENYERMQIGQVSETTVLERCRSYTKKSPTFSEKRGRFSKFRGSFF